MCSIIITSADFDHNVDTIEMSILKIFKKYLQFLITEFSNIAISSVCVFPFSFNKLCLLIWGH